MEIEKNKAIIEAILYSAGREVKMTELMSALELGANEIANIIESMKYLTIERNQTYHRQHWKHSLLLHIILKLQEQK